MSWRADDAAPTVHATASPATPRPRRAGRIASGAAAAVRAASAAAPCDDLDHLIGLHLRRLRRERRWSLDQLAAAAGVSRAMLGQIELGKSTPTVRVLMRIAAGLGVDAAALLAPARSSTLRVFRATATASAPVVRALDAGLPGATAFHAMHLPPGGAASHPQAPWACRVNAVVACGTVEVTVDGQALTLGEHDALQVDTSVALHWRNAGDGSALIHVVCARAG